jgi:hypothetical protein
VICAIAHTAIAAPGTPSLQRARQAWDEGELDQAERAYEDALDKGGLDRAATLECFVHLGAARSVLGNKSGALTAFRMALFVDDAFVVPPEAGKKAVVLAEAARRQPSRVGSLHLTLNVPSEAPSGEAFAVNAMLDTAQAALVGHLALHVDDKTTHKSFDHDEPAAAVVRFSVPASMTLPNATLHIQVDALDNHDNQLAFAEEHVGVRPTPIAETYHAKDELRHAHGGFWSTAWPYVIGGALIAAGGATTAYFLLKPPAQVSIDPAQLQTH